MKTYVLYIYTLLYKKKKKKKLKKEERRKKYLEVKKERDQMIIVKGTLMSSEGLKSPIHMKHLSAGVFHMPETRWNTSDLATIIFKFRTSS